VSYVIAEPLFVAYDPVTQLRVEPQQLGIVWIYATLMLVCAALCYRFVGRAGHRPSDGARVGFIGGTIPILIWIGVTLGRGTDVQSVLQWSVLIAPLLATFAGAAGAALASRKLRYLDV
jgi:hypothetical protein